MKSRRTGLPWIAWIFAACLGTTAPAPAAEEGDLPRVSELVRVEETPGAEQEQKKEAIFPRALSDREARAAATDILPGGALLYLESPAARTLVTAYGATAAAELGAEKEVERFFSENAFSLNVMLKDLPAEYGSEGTIALLRTLTRLVRAYGGAAGTAALAAYRGADERPVFVFLAEVGRDRKPAYDALQAILEATRAENPDLRFEETAHTDDYIETLRPYGASLSFDLSYGFVRQFFVLATSRPFAQTLLARAREGKYAGSLAESDACRLLAAKTAPESQLRGFVDLFALLETAEEDSLPEAGDALARAGELMSRTAIYYDLRVDAPGVYETFTLPASGIQGTGTVFGRMSAVTDSVRPFTREGLKTPKLMPYNPDAYIALRVKPNGFGALLKTELSDPVRRHAFQYGPAAGMIEPLVMLFGRMGERADALLLEGEIGLALNVVNAEEGESEWILALPLRDTANTAALLENGPEKARKLNGVPVYFASQEGEKAEGIAWAVFAQTETGFRNLDASFFVAASSGAVMERTIDALIGQRASLANNEDFNAQIARHGGPAMMLTYENTLKTIQTRYYQIPLLVRQLYPQIASLHALPRLTVVTKHLFGTAGAFAVTPEPELKVSMYSPMGAGPALAAQLALAAPQIIRLKENWQLNEARKRLGDLNLALQEYATQHGRYPRAVHGEAGVEFLAPLLPEPLDLPTLLTDPSAGDRLGADTARKKSYIYVPGLLPSDVPETVILYNAAPYHYHYSGEEVAETPVYEACRLVLTLDGKITAYSEEEFELRVLPKIPRR